jgi:hypothetical protein
MTDYGLAGPKPAGIDDRIVRKEAVDERGDPYTYYQCRDCGDESNERRDLAYCCVSRAVIRVYRGP